MRHSCLSPAHRRDSDFDGRVLDDHVAVVGVVGVGNDLVLAAAAR